MDFISISLWPAKEMRKIMYNLALSVLHTIRQPLTFSRRHRQRST